MDRLYCREAISPSLTGPCTRGIADCSLKAWQYVIFQTSAAIIAVYRTETAASAFTGMYFYFYSATRAVSYILLQCNLSIHLSLLKLSRYYTVCMYA